MPVPEEHADLQNLLTEPPDGMTVVRYDHDRFVVHYRRPGMGCMNTFLAVWLTLWTAGCVIIVHRYLTGAKMDDGSDIPFWSVSVFLAWDIWWACLLAYLLFTRKAFTFEPTRLMIESDTLGYKRKKEIPRKSIAQVVQVRDGVTNYDSFSSWGIRVEAEGRTSLLFRQPYDKTAWFGSVIAEWSGAPFKRVAPPAKRKPKR